MIGIAGLREYQRTPAVVQKFHMDVAEKTTYPVTFREVASFNIPMPRAAQTAHAAFLLKHPQWIELFWFAGEREGAADVQIYANRLQLTSAGAPQQGAHWSEAQAVVNRHQAAEQLGAGAWIRRLGNPAAWVDPQGRTHLYVVATLGGWSASRILHLRREPLRFDSADNTLEALTATASGFIAQSLLQLSPFFNISSLVRTHPIKLENGGALLPVYFELGNKYPFTITLEADGTMAQHFASISPIARRLSSLQPAIVVHSPTRAIAYTRDHADSQQLGIWVTDDAGKHWYAAPDAQTLINPDSAIEALRLPGGSTVLLRNPEIGSRSRLVAEVSVDGLHHWRLAVELEHGKTPEANEFSYPSAVIIGKYLHVSYTYARQYIKYRVFELQEAS